MEPWGRRALRERFDDGHHPQPARTPDTHLCDVYLATDASVQDDIVGFGALLERPNGDVLARWRRSAVARDNNDAEVRALHWALDRLSVSRPRARRVGIVVDHDPLARALAACAHPETQTPAGPPIRSGSPHHWGGITARIAAIPDVRVSLVSGRANPAHALAHCAVAD